MNHLLTALMINFFWIQHAKSSGRHFASGGLEAYYADRPYMVFLRVGRSICSGSIIADRWVLTAAHCLVGLQARDIRVLTRATSWQGQGLGAELAVIHEGYRKVQAHDIGLIKLVEPLNFSDTRISKIRLAMVDRFSLTGQQVWATGFGRRNPTDPNSFGRLVSARLFVQSQEYCWHRTPSADPNSMICAAGWATFTCSGDSGGPLELQWSNYPVQIGITSFVHFKAYPTGWGCSDQDPDYFTFVPLYLGWIQQIIQQNQ